MNARFLAFLALHSIYEFDNNTRPASDWSLCARPLRALSMCVCRWMHLGTLSALYRRSEAFY